MGATDSCCWSLSSEGIGRAVTPNATTLTNRFANRVSSGREAFVTMVQTTDLWNGDHLPSVWRMNRTGIRAVLSQRQMRSGSVIVVLVRREDLKQMALGEDDQVVQTFPPNRPDGSLDVWILPR